MIDDISDVIDDVSDPLAAEASSAGGLEQYTVAQVPVAERKGHAWHLLPVWLGSNVAPLTIATGLLGPTVYHLTLLWTIVAIIVGNSVGAIFMALHSAQGPRLGVPQMVQTRAQFGSRGSVLILLIVIGMFFGYLSSEVVVAGQALSQVITGLSADVAIVMSAVLTLAMVVVGYHFIHRFNQIMLPVFGLTATVALVWILVAHGVHATAPGLGITAGGFLGALSTAAVWQISYAPFVSDYSRYLPVDTSATKTFWATYSGTVLGSIPMMIIGALVGVLTSAANPLGDLKTLTGGAGVVIVLIFFLGAIDMAVFGLYSPMLTIITTVQTFKETWLPRARARIAVATAFAAVAAFVGIAFQDSFLVDYGNFLAILFYVLIPWSVINLIDYYVLRHGEYDVDSLFRTDGGRYGSINWATIGAYLIGIAVQVPFMSSVYWTGPIAKSLNGGDISWLVGLIVTAPVYYLLATRRNTRASGVIHHSLGAGAPVDASPSREADGQRVAG